MAHGVWRAKEGRQFRIVLRDNNNVPVPLSAASRGSPANLLAAARTAGFNEGQAAAELLSPRSRAGRGIVVVVLSMGKKVRLELALRKPLCACAGGSSLHPQASATLVRRACTLNRIALASGRCRSPLTTRTCWAVRTNFQ